MSRLLEFLVRKSFNCRQISHGHRLFLNSFVVRYLIGCLLCLGRLLVPTDRKSLVGGLVP